MVNADQRARSRLIIWSSSVRARPAPLHACVVSPHGLQVGFGSFFTRIRLILDTPPTGCEPGGL